MAAQSIRADGGYLTIVQGGGSDYLNYCEILKMKAETQPGEFVTSAGETAGDPVDLAASGDGDTGNIWVVLYEVGKVPTDIDTALDASDYGLCMRPTGGRFIIACWRHDESTSILKGQAMGLDTVGQLQTHVESSTNVLTMDFVGRLAADSSDVAATDVVILLYY
jgi:hypothetical protein